MDTYLVLYGFRGALSLAQVSAPNLEAAKKKVSWANPVLAYVEGGPVGGQRLTPFDGFELELVVSREAQPKEIKVTNKAV